MANSNDVILTTEQEVQLRRPIEDYVGKIQAEIDNLRTERKKFSLFKVILKE